MSNTVKIGDNIVGKIAVGLRWLSRDVRDSLNFNHVARCYDAHLDP